MSYKPNLAAHMPAASLSAAGSVHPPSTSMATSAQYRQLLSDYGPPSLGYPQGTGNSQVPQSKYAELLAIIEELGKEIRPTYAGSKSAMERLKRGIIHARGLNGMPGPSCLSALKVFHLLPRPEVTAHLPCSDETLVFKMVTVWFLLPVSFPWFMRL
ncbi:Cyclin-dependent kinase 2-associated protein 1 [Vulpes lagopus]